MFKKLLTSRTLNNPSLLTTGIPSISKVISRVFSEQDIIITDSKWDLLSAVCLERHPVITKPMKDIEVRYQKMLRQIEFENSLLSDFELQKEKEKEKEKGLNKKQDDPDVDVVTTQTVQDFEDTWEKELENFKFAPRENEAEDKVVASLRRKLDKNLLLLVECKLGNINFWVPPQSIRQDKETMIQTAHRSLQQVCGNNVKVQFYGNAPIGFYKYKYPKSVRAEGKDGAKVFYFLAKYISGDISSDVKHCWLDRDELKETVHPDVHRSLSQFLIPD